MICDCLESDGAKNTLATMLRTSHSMFNLVGPILYKDVVLTRSNASVIFKGLPFQKSDRKRTSRADWSENDFVFEALQGKDADWDDPPADAAHIPAKLVWPEVPLESEASSCSESDGPSDHGSGGSEEAYRSYHNPYPSVASQMRKLRLLRYIKKLVVHEVPSKRRSYLPRTWKGEKLKAFEGVTHLTLSAEALGDLVDWHDRHLEGDHPFLGTLRQHTRPQKFCVSYPTYSTEREYRTMRDRDWGAAQLAGNEDIYVDLSSRYLENVVKQGPGRIVDKLTDGWILQDITVHNIRLSCPPGLRHDNNRIFYAACDCEYHEPGAMHSPCSYGVEKDARLVDVASLVYHEEFDHDDLFHWEFINAHVTNESIPGEESSIYKEILRETVRGSGSHKVRFTDLEDEVAVRILILKSTS